jgi:hypothetical protein
MNFHQTLILNPRFDFLSFFDNQIFTDCEIHISETGLADDFQVIKGHRAILATASIFFENAFTAGMSEASTGVVNVVDVPYKPMLVLVRFLYSGVLRGDDSTIMQLYGLAMHFDVPCLLDLLDRHLGQSSADLILKYVSECFAYDLEKELKALEPFIAAKYAQISIENLSRALDIVTFLNVQALIQEMPLVQKFNDFVQFMGDDRCDADQWRAIEFAFGPKLPPAEARVLQQKRRQWCKVK